MSLSTAGRKALASLVLSTVVGLAPTAVAQAAGTSSITGAAFQDANRNGVFDAGETPWANHQLYVFDGSGAYVASAYSDAAGQYAVTGLVDGVYTVVYASPSWAPIRDAWVPTTTGSVYPSVALALQGSAVVNFGWRPIVWSTDVSAPISSYVGPSGLRAESFNDAVDARQVYDAVMRGGLIGPEAGHTAVRLGYGTTSDATSSVAQSNGTYTSFACVAYVTWSSWLDDRDPTIFHEYGHSWSMYNAYIVQQDGTFSAYLRARGLEGDARVGTSYKWSAAEMIAEDYRQLFGTPEGQSRPQANDEIPGAADVPGLRDFLATTYTSPPPSPAPLPPPPVTISALAMSPTTVTKSGTVSFTLSGPAAVTADIVDASGALVSTLIGALDEPAGTVSVEWDRTYPDGRRVKSGVYSVRVVATAAGASPTWATAPFTVR